MLSSLVWKQSLRTMTNEVTDNDLVVMIQSLEALGGAASLNNKRTLSALRELQERRAVAKQTLKNAMDELVQQSEELGLYYSPPKAFIK